jgi:hypothetical protein
MKLESSKLGQTMIKDYIHHNFFLNKHLSTPNKELKKEEKKKKKNT